MVEPYLEIQRIFLDRMGVSQRHQQQTFRWVVQHLRRGGDQIQRLRYVGCLDHPQDVITIRQEISKAKHLHGFQFYGR